MCFLHTLEEVSDVVNAMCGTRIRYLRCAEGLTQEQLGLEMGKTKNNISQYEHDKREPDMEAMKFLARRFHVSIDFLTGLDPYPNRHTRSVAAQTKPEFYSGD